MGYQPACVLGVFAAWWFSALQQALQAPVQLIGESVCVPESLHPSLGLWVETLTEGAGAGLWVLTEIMRVGGLASWVVLGGGLKCWAGTEAGLETWAVVTLELETWAVSEEGGFLA